MRRRSVFDKKSRKRERLERALTRICNEGILKPCAHCGSNSMTFHLEAQDALCKDCGKWSKARVNNLPKEQKANILAGVR